MDPVDVGVPSPSGTPKQKVRFPLRLGAELLVVFIGVLGAFWVEGYWQQQEDRERAGAILEALAEELDNFVVEGPYVVEGITLALASFEEAQGQGDLPPPAFYREPGAETPSISVWQATLSSGGVDLLDPELFFALAAFYNRVESASARYLRYNLFTEQEILPLLSYGPTIFYDAALGDLTPKYQVHMDLLRTIRDEVAVVVERAGSIRERVLAEREAMR